MYLTRFSLNTARRGARHLLSSQQRMHAAVLSSFPPSSEPGRVLWRVDQSSHRTDLFISGPSRPDLTHLVEQAGWPASATWDTADYRPFLDRIERGQRWAFRLTANPVRNLPQGPGVRGKVKAHVTAEEQLQWLVSRAPDLGLGIPTGSSGTPEVIVKSRRTARFKRGGDSGQEITVVMATFEGILEVKDGTRLREALIGGVGRSKAYGCGLLTLARI